MTPTLARSIAQAERATAQSARMTRLRAMSAAELTTTLGSDPATAAPWVEAAAACGLASAQVQWGRMLLEGAGVPQDRAGALRWFGKAARAGAGTGVKVGNGEACNMAGRCHELGWGTPPDAVAAVHWYSRAAAAGHDWGQYNLANMLFDGRGIAQDRFAAMGYYERAARAGHARAMNLLGRCYEEGWGTPRDPLAAAEWYRRSAAGGYFRGQYNHAVELFRQGEPAAAAAMFAAAATTADAPMRARIAAWRESILRLAQTDANWT